MKTLKKQKLKENSQNQINKNDLIFFNHKKQK